MTQGEAPDEGSLSGRADRPIDWPVVDAMLGRFTAVSVTSLLGAAIDAPWFRPWECHLTLLWLRAVSTTPSGYQCADGHDLGDLVGAAIDAGVDAPTQQLIEPNDPRHVVGFTVGGRRWRVHPGDYEYPLLVLRRFVATAHAVDPTLLQAVGFTLTDLIEVILAHGDDVLAHLGPTWPGVDGTAYDDAAELPGVSASEVDAVARYVAAQQADPGQIAARCSDPERAAAALTWLTRDAVNVAADRRSGHPLLGPVLRLRSTDGMIPVPASLSLAALCAAADTLLRRPELGNTDAERLRSLTNAHVYALVSKAPFDRSRQLELELSDLPIIKGPRTVMTVVSALTPDTLTDAIRGATDLLGRERSAVDGLGQIEAAVGPVSIVLYGGPLAITLHSVLDIVVIHVEELVELLDAARGDWTVVECFLQDLGQHTGNDALFFQDILDVWTAWRDWGRIGPPPELEGETTALHIVPAPHDITWQQAARWEPVDAVLAAANVPEHRDWPIARRDPSTGTADLFTTPGGTIALINADPAVIIFIDTADAAALHLDSDMLFGFADGVRYCINRRLEIAAHFRLVNTPITIRLRLTKDRAPDEDRGHGLRIAAAPDAAILEVAVGPDVLELFITDPNTAHDLLGVALYELVSRIRAGRGEPPGAPPQAFRDGWRQVGPLMTMHVGTASAPVVVPVDSLPRTTAIRARAVRAVADQLRRQVSPGAFTDADAHAICRDHLLPNIEKVLHDRIVDCDQTLIRKLALRLNAAYATYLRRSQQIAHALAGPWADNWQEAGREDRATDVATLQILFEAALADPPAGSRTVDGLDLGELAALAELMVFTVATDHGFERGLHGLRVDIDENGIYIIGPPPIDDGDGVDGGASLDVDLVAYHRAQTDQIIALAALEPWTVSTASEQNADDPPPTLPHADREHERVPFRPLRTIATPGLLAADALLQRGWGTGLDGIAAVLGTAVDWPTDDDGIATIGRDELTREAAEWSNLPDTQVQAAVEHLIIDGEQLNAAGDRRYLDVERRAHRLASRPLPVIDGQILLLPWLVVAAQHLYNGYLAAARLPQPADALPPGVVDAMTEYRKGSNNELETTVRDIVAAVGLPHRFQFNQNDQVHAGIPRPVGEIDLLIADAANGRLWVCEVKDPITAYSASSMRNHIRAFTHSKGYIAKLRAKTEQIERYAINAALACGVTETRSWRVVPLLVTRHVEPTAHTKNQQVAFTLPDLLEAVLRNPDDPNPGPAPEQPPAEHP